LLSFPNFPKIKVPLPGVKALPEFGARSEAESSVFEARDVNIKRVLPDSPTLSFEGPLKQWEPLALQSYFVKFGANTPETNQPQLPPPSGESLPSKPSPWEKRGPEISTQQKWDHLKLNGIDWSGANLSGTDFSGSSLRWVNFQHANLENVNFKNADLRMANFQGANLKGANLRGAILGQGNKPLTHLADAIIDENTLLPSSTKLSHFTWAKHKKNTLDCSQFNQPEVYHSSISPEIRQELNPGGVLSGMNLPSLEAANLNLQLVDFEKASLPHSNFEGADLRGVDFSGADLTGVNFKGADLTDANFTDARLNDANFEDALLFDSNFSRSNLESTSWLGADISGALFSQCSFKNANLSGLSFEHASGFEQADFNGANLSFVNFNHANLTNAKFQKTDLSETSFKDATLRGADLSQSILNKTNFRQCDLSKVNLSGAKLTDAVLVSANLKEANLNGVEMVRTPMARADLTGATLEKAKLTEVDLSFVNAELANFKEAHFANGVGNQGNFTNTKWEGADCSGTQFQNAKFHGASLYKTNLSSAQLKNAILTGTNLQGTNFTGADLEGAQCQEASFSPETKFPNGFDPEKRGLFRGYPVQINGNTEYYSLEQLNDLNRALITKIHNSAYQTNIESFKNPYHRYLAASAYLDAHRVERSWTGLPLNRLLPHLLFAYPSGQLTPLIKGIETFMDNNTSYRELHPNEAELFALLNHPKNTQRTGQDINTLTLALTSITRFINDSRTRVTGQTVNNWARIGLLTQGFQFWKYDTQRVMASMAPGVTPKVPSEAGESGMKSALPPIIEMGTSASSSPAPLRLKIDAPTDSKTPKVVKQLSLMELFGFKAIPKRPTDTLTLPDGSTPHLLGPGFELVNKPSFFYKLQHNGTLVKSKFDPKTYVEFRRAYLMVSHPDHGTLIIRNSSPDFGRHSMKHPAYWSPKGILNGFMKDDLQELDQSAIESKFTHILALNINHESVKLQEHMAFLLDHLIGVKESYGAWKFDTQMETAWDKDMLPGETLLVGGQNSPGFKALAQYLALKWEQNSVAELMGQKTEKLPDLAFVHPDFPPWETHPFVDQNGVTQKTFVLTDERVKALKDLSEGKADETQMETTGLRNFLQQAGFTTQGELILKTPA
jgi:uncharacterized protein YjbI with pentapeptide repeats